MPKAYSYLRFSTPEQSRGDSFRRQSEAAGKYAAAHGLELDESSFEDLGVSAFRGSNADTGRLGEFLEAVRSGSIEAGSYLLVESLDRLSRQVPRKAVRLLEDICDEGIAVVTLADGREYTSGSLDTDPTAFMWAFMVAVRANEESETKARRLRAAWKQKRANIADARLTRRCPGWLEPDDENGFRVIPERADVVQEIFELAAKGVGKNSIASALNGREVPCFGRGSQWHPSYIGKLLRNPAVIGRFIPHTIEYKDGKRRRVPGTPVDNYFPSICEPQVYQDVQSLLETHGQTQRGRHARSEIRNILAGLACCPKCNSAMTRVTKGSKKRSGHPYLVCVRAKNGGGCDYRAVKLQPIEEWFRLGWADLLLDAPLASDAAQQFGEELEGVELELDQCELQIEKLLDTIQKDGSIAARVRLGELEAQIPILNRKRSELMEMVADSQEPIIASRLEKLATAFGEPVPNVGDANRALRMLFDKVVVDYQIGQLKFHWRVGGVSLALFDWDAAITS